MAKAAACLIGLGRQPRSRQVNPLGIQERPKVQPFILTNGTDDGQMVMRQALVQHRRVGHRRVRPHNGRQQVKAALINEHHLAILLLRLIF
jgi:hypothetical protein